LLTAHFETVEYKDSDGFRRKLVVGLFVISTAVILIQTAMLLGVFLADDQNDKLNFMFAYYGSFIGFGIACIFLFIRYYSRLLRALQEHVKLEASLRPHRDIQSRAEVSLNKLRRFLAVLYATVIFMMINSILCISMPVAANYLGMFFCILLPSFMLTTSFMVVPMYTANGAVSISGFLREVGELTEEVNSKSESSTQQSATPVPSGSAEI